MLKKSQGKKSTTSAVVISSRLRLARNLAGERFTRAQDAEGLARVFDICAGTLSKLEKRKAGKLLKMENVSERARATLFESGMIGSEFLDSADYPRGIWLAEDDTLGLMINEEDHLRLFAFGKGLALTTLWKKLDAFDNSLEKYLEFAYSEKYGYLTSCPTNVGTGMRASVKMHLPALATLSEMEKVDRAVSQLGMVLRGSNGEGSPSDGEIFQLSNQTTLGISEADTIHRISDFAKKLKGLEADARARLEEDSRPLLADRFCRAIAILQSSRIIDTHEALTHLSSLRLAADMGYLDGEDIIEKIDALMCAVQPAHMSETLDIPDDSDVRDEARATLLRESVKTLPKLNLKSLLKK